MRTYYFDTKDGVPVRDRVGLEFANASTAIKHSKQMASKIRRENPSGDVDRHVVVIDESGKEIHREAIYPT
ncbi:MULTISPECIES: DUF6894 family protein [Bradyrhizobium]|uniref:DUF6894 domain-containing protein n=1 Tax=Bradyrhizobium septentrionale TaxID=1404411 RepID=A0ABZ2P205_9BRAD